MFLLDTNVLSELRPGKRGADRLVLQWAASVQPARVYLPVIAVMEIEQGVLAMERRDAAQGAVLRAWWEPTLKSFDGRVLGLDRAAGLRCAALQVPDPKPYRDAMIAAIALTHALTVVTRNVADFATAGVPLFNPFALPTRQE